MNLITEQHVILDMEGSTQREILHAPAGTAFHEGKASDTDTFFRELYKREQEYTAGFGKGITISHARRACIKEAGTLSVRMKHKIEWKSIGEKPVEAAICLPAPDDRRDFHLKALLRLARRLMREDFVNISKTAEKRQVLSEIIDTAS